MSDGDVGTAFFTGVVLSAIVGALIPNTSVTELEWEFASKSCAVNGGVDYTRGSGMIRSQKVVCKNMAEFIRKPSDE